MMKIRNIVITLILCLSSCVNPLQEEQDKTEGEALDEGKLGAPTDNIPGSVITGHEIIILTFNETVTSATFSGTLTEGVTVMEVWTDTVFTDDTVHLHLYSSYTPPTLPSSAPAEFWPEGAGKTLIIDATGESGKVLSGHTKTYGVFNGVCVDDSGNPTGLGSTASPFDTIQAGINRASDWYSYSGISEVRVAGGTYAESGPVVTMADGVSVLGRWTADFDTRSTSLYTTTIRDTRTSGGWFMNPIATVYSDITYTQPTVLSRFTIEIPEVSGGGDSAGSGIHLDGADDDLTLQNLSIINQGNTTYPNWSYGIYIEDCTGTAINECDIEPDDTEEASYGVVSLTSTAIIHDCQIFGGNAGHTNSSAASYGIMTNSSLTITGNSAADRATIDAGTTPATPYGIFIAGTAAPVIQYIHFDSASGAYYLFENTATSSPAVFSDNYFGTLAGIWYTDNDNVTEVRYNTFFSTDVTVGGETQSLDYWNNDGENAQ